MYHQTFEIIFWWIIIFSFTALAVLGCASAQRQRPRGGRQGTGYSAPADNGYAAPANDPQPAYGNNQDVYQVTNNTTNNIMKTYKFISLFSFRELPPAP